MKFINDSVGSCVEDYAKDVNKARERLTYRLSTIKSRMQQKLSNTVQAIAALEDEKKETEATLLDVAQAEEKLNDA